MLNLDVIVFQIIVDDSCFSLMKSIPIAFINDASLFHTQLYAVQFFHHVCM